MDDDQASERRAKHAGKADACLVRRAIEGDGAARGELETRLARIPDLVRACHGRMQRPLCAEELDEAVQDVSLTVCRRIDAFRGTSRLETWIYGIARLSILTRLQGLRRERLRMARNGLSPEELRDELEGTARADDSGMRLGVDAGLRAAGGTVETIVRRRHLDGDSFGAIGRDLHLPEATVKSRYYRGIPRIRRALGRIWGEIEG